MKTRCSVCLHVDRKLIDQALVAGTSERTIAKKFSLGRGPIGRHGHEHLDKAAALAKNKPAQWVTFSDGNSVIREIESLYNKHMSASVDAKAASDSRMVIREHAAAAALLQSMAKAFNLFQPDGSVNIIIAADSWESRLTRAISHLSDLQLDAFLIDQISLETLALAAEDMQRNAFATIVNVTPTEQP